METQLQCIRWSDGTTRNDVSRYEFSETPDPLDETSWKRNVPALIDPCQFASYYTYSIMNNDRGVSMPGYCVTRDLSFEDQGSQNIRTGTHISGTSRHPTML